MVQMTHINLTLYGPACRDWGANPSCGLHGYAFPDRQLPTTITVIMNDVTAA